MKQISEFIDGEVIYDSEGYFYVKNDNLYSSFLQSHNH
jgi:hypothetical protein